jgi:hypothetical protein
MRYLIFLILLIASLTSIAQRGEKMSKVTYFEFNDEGKIDDSKLDMHVIGDVAHLSEPGQALRYFQDFSLRQMVCIMEQEKELFVTLDSFDSLPQPTFIDSSITILGYKCTQARFMYFSNTIDVWYTEKSGIKGCPYSRYVVSPDALALKIVVNGNHTLIATEINKWPVDKDLDYTIDRATKVTNSELEQKKIQARYTVVHVFDHDTINFDPSLPEPSISKDYTGKVYRVANGGVIIKKIKIPESHSKGGYVHAKVTSWSAGDAYDRTGAVFTFSPADSRLTILDAIIDSVGVLPFLTDVYGENYQGYTQTADYNPPIELMRFFTSFGVNHFNNLREINGYEWENEVVYNQEISNLIPRNEDEMWIGAFIANYDGGGHRISLDLNFYPAFDESDANTRWIEPLFNTVNILEMAGQNYPKLFKSDTLTVQFDVPENVENTHLLYTATGHGGWGEGDEFTPREHQIVLDGEVIYTTTPWRTDCATYRLSNPASGNFGNGLSSSDLSRSNWCPATLTAPDRIALNHLAAGSHIIQVIIDQGPDVEGGINYWCVSGVLVGDMKLID